MIARASTMLVIFLGLIDRLARREIPPHLLLCRSDCTTDHYGRGATAAAREKR